MIEFWRGHSRGANGSTTCGLTYHLWYRHNVACGASRSTGRSISSWTLCRRTSSSATKSGLILPCCRGHLACVSSRDFPTSPYRENGKDIDHLACPFSIESFTEW